MADLISMLAAVAGSGGGVDPNFNQTVLLLHGDGTNGAQNNTFLDSSSNNFTITRNGNVTQGSFGPFSRSSGNLVNAPYDPAVHGGSGYFDISGDYLAVLDNSAFDFGSNNFTTECWFNLKTLPVFLEGYTFISQGRSTTSNLSWWFFLFNNGVNYQFFFSYSTTGSNQTNLTFNLTSAPTVGSWNHVAFVRSGTDFLVFLNGSQVGTTKTLNATIFNSTAPIWIGASNDAGSSLDLFNGYISNIRVVKGRAVYTSAFTPPTAPLGATSGGQDPPQGTETSLLLNFTNAGIIDNTGKNVLETVGNAQINTTTKKYGTGSLEFDGTGDWLLMPNTPDQQLGTGNFTIEFWVYLATGDTGSARGLVAKGTSTTGWLVSLDSSQKVVFTYTTSTITSSGAITTNAWNHIAVVRSGTGSNQTKIYISGTNDGTGTVSTDFNQTESMYVGANRTGGDPMKGFIDDLRITKGVARYTANFTPPTAAFPNE